MGLSLFVGNFWVDLYIEGRISGGKIVSASFFKTITNKIDKLHEAIVVNVNRRKICQRNKELKNFITQKTILRTISV